MTFNEIIENVINSISPLADDIIKFIEQNLLISILVTIALLVYMVSLIW